MFFVLRAYQKRNRYPGSVFPLFVVLYSGTRFCTEFLRADFEPLVWRLTTYHFQCLAELLLGVIELLLLRMPKSALDLQNLINVMTRMQYDYPGVILRHVRHVTVTTDEELPWSLDGEYCPSAPRVEIENLPAAVQLVH